MAQWPFAIPPMSAKPPMPAPIPEQWQKANAALQAINQPKSGTSESTSQEQPAAASDFSNGYGWANPVYSSFPGFSGYPSGYGFYNYNYNYVMNNSPLFMNAMPSQQPQVPVPPRSVGLPESSEEDPNAGNISVSSLASQPPPPPPTSSPIPNNEVTYFTNIVKKQAPDSGGIKFSLPKKKNQKNFQSSQDNAFQDYSNDSPQQEDTLNGPGTAHSNIFPPKKVSAMCQDKWPESLKTYVNHCFTKCKSDFDKDQVEIILRGKLLKAVHEKYILTKDWSKEPFPSLHSERLEQEQKMQVDIKKESPKASPVSKNHYNRSRSDIFHSRSRSRSRSYSRSRSRSLTPPRKFFRRKKHSSASDSSDDSRESRRTLSSSIIGPSELRNFKNSTQKNKRKRKRGNKIFSIDPEYSTDERLMKRAARFEVKGGRNCQENNLVFTITNPFVIDETGADIEWGSDAIIGTCQELEKPFLRLTGAVDPSSVRPLEVLMKSLTMVKDHWMENQDYHFVCEQLKSIRQDLVVQCIRNDFTVKVYETHARIALEKGDHTEFNQCQSQLKALYQEVQEGNRLEFTGYHILYTIYTENTLEMKNILADLALEDKKDEVVSHALKIAKAWSSSNYHRFFKLYVSSPKMSSFVIDWFIERMRKSALKAIIKSFRPNLPVSYIQSALAFPSSEECMAFLTKANLIFVDSDVVNCKESMVPVTNF